MGKTQEELERRRWVGETTNQKGVLGVGKTPEEPERRRGVGETTNQKGVLGVVKTPEAPERRRGIGELTNQKGVLGMGKTQEELERRRWVGETTNQKGVLGVGKTPEEPERSNKVLSKSVKLQCLSLSFCLCVLCNYPTIVRVFWYRCHFWSLDILKHWKKRGAHRSSSLGNVFFWKQYLTLGVVSKLLGWVPKCYWIRDGWG